MHVTIVISNLEEGSLSEQLSKIGSARFINNNTKYSRYLELFAVVATDE
jgi:hypothetical protein